MTDPGTSAAVLAPSPMPGARRFARAPTWRTVLRVVGLVAVLAAAVAVLRDRLPHPLEVWRALLAARPWWVVAAVVAEGVSLGMFAHQQRRLLRAFGVRMSMRRARAITFSRTAIAISLPAGSAVSAGFAFRQFRAGGASKSTAATVMVLSGLVSTVALALLYLSGLLAIATRPLMNLGERHPVLVTGIAVVVAGLAAAGIYLLAAHHADHHDEHRTLADSRAVSAIQRRWPRVARAARPTAEALDTARAVPARHWTLALTYAAVNWLADLGCLVAASRAFGLTLSLTTLAAVYIGVQIVRQIPLTPGGVGLIEASLLTGMVSAGAPQAAAAAAILVYRLLTCWLIIPVGLIAWSRLRRLPGAGGRQPADGSPAEAAGERIDQPQTDPPGRTTP